MNTDTPVRSAGGSLWLSLLRAFVALVLALALTVIVALLVLSLALGLASTPVFSGDSGTIRGAVGIFMLLVILVPLITWVIALRRGTVTWRRVGIGWILVLPVFIWLAWDDATVRQPVTYETLSPVQPGDERSEAVLMQYSSKKPSAEAKAFAESKAYSATLGTEIKDTVKRREYVAAHREEIEAAWVALAPQRRWLDELSGFERIGDLTPPRIDANLMRFDVWRVLAMRTRAHATLLALDGKGDEAIASLLPLIAVAQKLQQNGRTLVRVMVATTIERTAIEAALEVLELTPVSAENRARLAELMAGKDDAQGARRLLLLEYAQFAPFLQSMRLGDALAMQHGTHRSWVTGTLNFLSSIFVNVNATTNRYGDRIFALADLAAARDLKEVSLQTKKFEESIEREGGMKNLGGRLMLASSIPAYDKILDSYWKTVDQRAALRTRATQ